MQCSMDENNEASSRVVDHICQVSFLLNATMATLFHGPSAAMNN